MVEITLDTLPEISEQRLTPTFGAAINCFDLGRDTLSAALGRAIETKLKEHRVLLFRSQMIDDEKLLAFSRLLGELDFPGPNPYGEPFHKRHPEINIISNVVVDGRPVGNLGSGEAVWHADMTYVEHPPKAAVLYALEVPPSGGDTYFADMISALETLPATLRQRIEGLSLVHDASRNSSGELRKGYDNVTDPRQTRGARHPLIRRDPTTGREALFLGRRRNAYVVGLPLEESEALLDALWKHATTHAPVLRHQWQVHDILIWDNQNVLHRRDEFDPSTRRIMHRTQISGR